MQLLFEEMWDKVAYDLKDSRKAADYIEYFYDSKGIKSVFNGRILKYHSLGGVGGVGFICFLSPMTFLMTLFE